jgi:putative phosphoesterase
VQKIELTPEDKFKIGVISDTHGLLRPGVIDAFKGVNLIVHAGDIGKPEIINSLKEIAPVIAVHGNVDMGYISIEYPADEMIIIGEVRIYLIHNIDEFNYRNIGKPDAVIFGHSHKPLIKKENSILFFNPGSAGPQRFSLPVSAGIMEILGNNISAYHIKL